MIGQVIRALAAGLEDAGTYTVQFDGSGLPSGVYFYRMHAGNFMSMKKLLLVI
jgi:hypothetical protein